MLKNLFGTDKDKSAADKQPAPPKLSAMTWGQSIDEATAQMTAVDFVESSPATDGADIGAEFS